MRSYLKFSFILILFTFLNKGFAEDNRPTTTLLRPLKTTLQRIEEHNYAAERHTVTTEDGYILTIFRIPAPHSQRLQKSQLRRRRRQRHRPIVLLQHGLFSTSDFWLLNGPNDALPFLLSNAGYDVWLGNARGNHYARNHTTLKSHQSKFWQFSWHEIGHYDIAAMIDYILAINRQDALHYIGYSQGTTSFFALLSTRPAWNVRIKTAHMLAPVTYMGNATFPLMRMLGPYLGKDGMYARLLAQQEFIPYNEVLLLLFFNTCGTQGTFFEWCVKLLPWIPLMSNKGRHNKTAIMHMMDTFSGGCSTNQILHYMQSHIMGDFRQFDLGRSQNSQYYGQLIPPSYNLELITTHMHLWYSDNDAFAAVDDVLRMAQQLPKKTMHHVEDSEWGHGEFLYSMFVKSVINEPIIEILNKYEMDFEI